MKCQNGFTSALAVPAWAALVTSLAVATSPAAHAQDALLAPKLETQPKPLGATASPQPATPDPTAPPVQAPVQLVYSPWTKICGKDTPPATSKVVCLVVKEARIKEARLEVGQFAASAALVEAEDEPKKILRVILPLGMQIQPGTRIFIDQGPPTQRPFLVCFSSGCMSDYEADATTVTKLAKGQDLVIQAIDADGQPVAVKLPLADFGKAYDGPPIDPKVLEEREKRLQDEIQGAGASPKGNAGE